jgi:hypothetical protein
MAVAPRDRDAPIASKSGKVNVTPALRNNARRENLLRVFMFLYLVLKSSLATTAWMIERNP